MTNEKIIGDRKYKCEPFMFTTAAPLLRDIGEIIAPGIGALTGAVEKIDSSDLSNSKINTAGLGAAIEGVFQKLPEEKLLPLLCRLLKNVSTTITKQDGSKIHVTFSEDTIQKMNMCFSGEHMMDGFILIPFILGVNFPPLARLGANFGTQIQKIVG
jgi:hypothetical protein